MSGSGIPESLGWICTRRRAPVVRLAKWEETPLDSPWCGDGRQTPDELAVGVSCRRVFVDFWRGAAGAYPTSTSASPTSRRMQYMPRVDSHESRQQSKTVQSVDCAFSPSATSEQSSIPHAPCLMQYLTRCEIPCSLHPITSSPSSHPVSVQPARSFGIGTTM